MRNDEQKQLVFQHLQARWSSGKSRECHRASTDPPSIEQLLSAICQSCPDLEFTVDEVIAEGSRIVARWTLRGTDTRGYQRRLPTGRQIAIKGIQLIRCEDDRVIEEWEMVDRLDSLLQLGYVCLPKPPNITLRRPVREEI